MERPGKVSIPDSLIQRASVGVSLAAFVIVSSVGSRGLFLTHIGVLLERFATATVLLRSTRQSLLSQCVHPVSIRCASYVDSSITRWAI